MVVLRERLNCAMGVWGMAAACGLYMYYDYVYHFVLAVGYCMLCD